MIGAEKKNKHTVAIERRQTKKKSQSIHTDREPKVNLHQTDSISFANRCTFRLPLATRVQCGKTLHNFIYAPAIFDSLKTFSIFVLGKKSSEYILQFFFLWPIPKEKKNKVDD